VRNRRGWTMIELLVVMIILGLLASIAVLKYIDMRRTALAAKVASEFVAIRFAAYSYEADHSNQFPPDAGPGIVPVEMVPYLPAGFTFTQTLYSLDWDNFMAGGGGAYQLGITCTSTDPAFINSLIANLGTRAPYFVVGGNLTYVLIDASGNY